MLKELHNPRVTLATRGSWVLVQEVPAIINLLLVKPHYKVEVLHRFSTKRLDLLWAHALVIYALIPCTEKGAWRRANEPRGLFFFNYLSSKATVGGQGEIPWFATWLHGP